MVYAILSEPVMPFLRSEVTLKRDVGSIPHGWPEMGDGKTKTVTSLGEMGLTPGKRSPGQPIVLKIALMSGRSCEWRSVMDSICYGRQGRVLKY